jgi:GNAT superfamily N-acetyltransferase
VDVRRRRDDDLAACVAALRATHEADGYPMVWPADPAGWLAPDGMLGAWVATDDDAVLGQALVRDGRDLERPDELAAAAGVPVAGLGSLGRLYVAPSARRRGVAGALLRHATRTAAVLGRRLALDVVADDGGAATALYERHGWRRVTAVPAAWTTPDGTRPTILAYLSPST